VATRSHAVFLKTEVQTGLLFAKIALESKNPHKISRNTLNARKAYDTLLYFLNDTVLNEDADSEFHIKLATLRGNLLELGEYV